MLISAILTHGRVGVGKLAGCDGDYITIHSILDKFTEGKCPSLSKKPKIIFIQACQGEESQEECTLQTDPPSQPLEVDTEHDKLTPKEEHFILCLATIPGHESSKESKKLLRKKHGQVFSPATTLLKKVQETVSRSEF